MPSYIQFYIEHHSANNYLSPKEPNKCLIELWYSKRQAIIKAPSWTQQATLETVMKSCDLSQMLPFTYTIKPLNTHTHLNDFTKGGLKKKEDYYGPRGPGSIILCLPQILRYTTQQA